MSLFVNKITEICLRASGIWPYSVNILGPVVLLSTLVTTLPFQIWKAVLLVNNPALFMDSLSDILAEILIFMKLFALWMRKRFDISLYVHFVIRPSRKKSMLIRINSKIGIVTSTVVDDLIRRINKDWDKKNLPEEWKILAHYCYLFCKFDITLYISASIFYYPDLISTYLKKPYEARQLLFQSYYPFEYQSSPWYEFLFVVQMFQAFFMMSVDSLSKSLLVTYVLHVGARMNLLEYHVSKYSNTCSDEKYINDGKNFKNIKNIIIEHQNILSLAQNIDYVYSYISLFQIVFSNIIICVTGFVMITAVESSNVILLFKFFTYIMAMLSQAFTFCIAGQYLQNKGEFLTHLIYSSFWYKTRPTEMKNMLFILSNAQKPLILKGGKIVHLSIDTFAQILKTSFSYLSVLRAIYI